MKNLTCVLISSLLVNTLPALAADNDRLIRQANRYFAPLPANMPGSENDSAETDGIISFLNTLTDNHHKQ